MTSLSTSMLELLSEAVMVTQSPYASPALKMDDEKMCSHFEISLVALCVEMGWEGLNEGENSFPSIAFLLGTAFIEESTYKWKWEFYYMFTGASDVVSNETAQTSHTGRKFNTELFFCERQHFGVVFCDDAWGLCFCGASWGKISSSMPNTKPFLDHQFFISQCSLRLTPSDTSKRFSYSYLFHQSNVLRKLKVSASQCMYASARDDAIAVKKVDQHIKKAFSRETKNKMRKFPFREKSCFAGLRKEEAKRVIFIGAGNV